MKRILTITSLLAFGGAATFAAGGQKHHVAAFSGATTTTTNPSNTDFTLGAAYEFRTSSLLGIGPVADFVFASKFAALFMGGMFFHPAGDLKLVAAPGIKFQGGLSAFVMRFGVGYDFHSGPLIFTPTFNIDLISGDAALVWGIAIGTGF